MRFRVQFRNMDGAKWWEEHEIADPKGDSFMCGLDRARSASFFLMCTKNDKAKDHWDKCTYTDIRLIPNTVKRRLRKRV